MIACNGRKEKLSMIQQELEYGMLEGYPDIMLPTECMEALGIGRTMFYKLVGSGELPAKRIGNKIWRIAKVDLIAYMMNH